MALMLTSNIMKLSIINSEKFNEICDININPAWMVDDINYVVNQFQDEQYSSLDLIYKNCILNERKSLLFYNIQSNDTIWAGKIENYMTLYNVILDVFVFGKQIELIHIIVNKHETMAGVVLVMQKLFPTQEYHRLWNVDGQILGANQIVNDLCLNDGQYKIILDCSDEEEELTFDECCKIHDRYIIENFLWRLNKYLFDKVEVYQLTTDINNYIKDFLCQLDHEHRLNVRLSKLHDSLLNSKYICCLKIADRIFNIYREILLTILDKCNKSVFDGVVDYIRVTLRVAMLDYLIHRENEEYTMQSIAKRVTQSLLNINYDYRTWMKPIISSFLLRPVIDDEIDNILQYINQQHYCMKVKRCFFFIELQIPKESNTVRQVKKEVFLKIGKPLYLLYFINITSDQKPNDMDFIDVNNPGNYIIEAVETMDNITILGYRDRGGFGEIKIYRHEITNETFAMKIQREGDLYRDICIQYTIDLHADIVKSTGLFYNEEKICLGLEFLTGDNLRKYLDDFKPLPENDIARITYHIATELKEIHDQGITHRDIKPENIVFDENGKPLLVDYGKSKRINDLSEDDLLETLGRSSPGTIYYMAPESISTCSYTNKVDIWSLGVVVVEMLTGQKPYSKFSDVKAGKFIKEKKKIDVKIPLGTSKDLIDFIDCCLKSDPKERPTATDLLQTSFIQNFIKTNNHNDLNI